MRDKKDARRDVVSGPAPDPSAAADDWDLAPIEPPAEAFVVGVAGFEGPLDLLLALARTHKLDLSAISLLELADQYLAFIAESSRLRLEIAADYLVMAAWLTFLKSRLLLPKEKTPEGELSGEEMASRLAFRLMRLEAMRTAGAQLLTRRRYGRDFFGRGMPEGIRSVRTTRHTATIYDLLKAYADQRLRTLQPVHVVRARTVWSIKEARVRLERLVGVDQAGWLQLDLFLDQYLPSQEVRRTVLASSFGASLELAREGVIELEQAAPFAPLYLRRRKPGSGEAAATLLDGGA